MRFTVIIGITLSEQMLILSVSVRCPVLLPSAVSADTTMHHSDKYRSYSVLEREQWCSAVPQSTLTKLPLRAF